MHIYIYIKEGVISGAFSLDGCKKINSLIWKRLTIGITKCDDNEEKGMLEDYCEEIY